MDPSKVPKPNEHQPRAPSMQDVDVDWSSVDPAAVASLQMALAMGLRPEEIHAALGGDDGVRRMAAAAQVAQRATEAMQLTAALGDVIEDASKPETAEEAQRWDELLAEAAAAAATWTTEGADDEMEHGKVDCNETNDATHGEDGGMEHAYTAEGSWGGENSEWALDKIVRRRKARGGSGGNAGDGGDPDYQGDDGAWEYLCVWRGYAEATWERRGFLRDQGFGRDIEAFDAQRAPHKKTSTLRLMPQKPSRFSLMAARDNRPLAKDVALAMSKVVTEFTNLISDTKLRGLHAMFLHLASAILKRPVSVLQQAVDVILMHLFSTAFSANLSVDAITLIYPETLDDHWAYVEEIAGAHDVPPLQVVFHGTSVDAVKPISKKGLIIPGKGNDLSVRNGQVLGLGVYSATELGTPTHYAHNGDYFLCSSYAPPATTSEVLLSGSIRVFFDVRLITPLLHIKATKTYNPEELKISFTYGRMTRFVPPQFNVAVRRPGEQDSS